MDFLFSLYRTLSAARRGLFWKFLYRFVWWSAARTETIAPPRERKAGSYLQQLNISADPYHLLYVFVQHASC